jgi:hypothetical protein
MTSGIEDIANGDGVSPANLSMLTLENTVGYHNVYVKLQEM